MEFQFSKMKHLKSPILNLLKSSKSVNPCCFNTDSFNSIGYFTSDIVTSVSFLFKNDSAIASAHTSPVLNKGQQASQQACQSASQVCLFEPKGCTVGNTPLVLSPAPACPPHRERKTTK